MKKITKLTPEQETALTATLQHWLAIGRSTDPLNRTEASAAITETYRAIGKEAPVILYFSSPVMCILAWGVLRATAKDQLRGQLGDQLGGQLRDQLGGQLRDQLRGQLWGQLRDQLGSQLWGQLRDQLGGQLGDQLRGQLGDQLWGQLGDQLGSQLGDQLGGQLWDQLGGQLGNYFAGNQWCAWEVFYDYCNQIGVVYTNEQKALLALWLRQSRNCHWWFPYEGVCFASERPTSLDLDANGRLHSLSGAAIRYADGWGVHAVHGVRVPEYVIERPQEITVSRIDSERNAEVRRVMLDRYGTARFMRDCGARVIQELPADHPIKGLRTARLLFREIPDDEPIVMVDLLNSTAEPDGTTKRYLLRVDPAAYAGKAANDCMAAAASTWRKPDGSLYFNDYRDYLPAMET